LERPAATAVRLVDPMARRRSSEALESTTWLGWRHHCWWPALLQERGRARCQTPGVVCVRERAGREYGASASVPWAFCSVCG